MPDAPPSHTTQWDSGANIGRSSAGVAGHPPVNRDAAASLHVVVVGAGAFGGWTAWHLLNAGARVTLVDSWGPGNARSSSGGETRVLRFVYGADQAYVEWTVKAREMWKRYQEAWNERLYRPTDILWMVGGDDRYVRASMPVLSGAGIPYEELTSSEAATRFTQIDFDGVDWALVERGGGYLNAARACRAVHSRFVGEGGTYLQQAASVARDELESGEMKRLILSDGETIAADRFVFACGPWLGRMFPDDFADLIHATRQEVYYVGSPAGNLDFHQERMPVWIDFSDPLYYGIPATDSRGFKIANDARDAEIDPTTADRTASPEQLRESQRYLGYRFPALKNAPLVEARVCQYANSRDGHLIVDRHPAASNVWLVGGGSGHAFKLGPALGEFVAYLVAGDEPAHPFFSLDRFGR